MARILQQNVVDREGAGGTKVRRCRDSGNNFGVPEIELLPGHISFILFLFPHVVSSRFFKRKIKVVSIISGGRSSEILHDLNTA